MEIVVFGAGSLGSLIGGLLERSHDVTLVGRDPHVAAVRESGLRLTGLEDFTVDPEATTDGTDLRADFALVTVKAYDTKAAAADLATGTFEAVVSLQNGMGNEDVLADELDCPVLAGTASYGAFLREPGVVEWTGEGEIVIGPWTPRDTPLPGEVAGALSAADIDAEAVPDARPHLWEKLAINAALNPVTALARVRNGALLSGPVSRISREAARETATVARSEGIDLADQRAMDRAEAVIGATAPNRSSMLQDLSAGKRTEIEAITGFIVRRAGEHGVEVPVNRTLHALVHAWEAGQDHR